jgi:hypothetical protein
LTGSRFPPLELPLKVEVEGGHELHRRERWRREIANVREGGTRGKSTKFFFSRE